MTAHGDGLRTSNPLGGANVEVSTGRDGSYIAGSFTLAFGKWLFRLQILPGFLQSISLR
jgi:hypothetical protein